MPQVQFEILGLTLIPPIILLQGEAVSEFERTFYNVSLIVNDGPGPLTGLTARPLLPNATDIHIQIFLRGALNNTLLPGNHLIMDIRVATSAILSGSFLVSIEAMEGTSLQVIANLEIDSILPSLTIDPPVLTTRIVRGSSRIFQFNVTNSGRALARDVGAILPDTNFISFVSFGTLQEGNLQLENGESALLSILVQSPTDQQLGEIDATIIVVSSEVYTPLPISVIVSSDLLMNLTILVEDEYTYFANGRPLVSDAVVTIINLQRNIQLAQTTDANNGSTDFINIFEDRYEMIVEAPSHRTLRQIVVTSITSPVITVFIERQTVVYSWSVTPITYQDVYLISIEADFETRVPVPVVTVTPHEINLDELEDGNITSFQLNITNHGLIRADNVGIQLPRHPFLEFSTDIESLGHLEPLSSVIVSIQSTRKSRQRRNAFNRLGDDLAEAVNWAIYVVDVVHSYVCNEPQFRNTPVVLKQSTICGSQLSQPIGNTIPTPGNRGADPVYYTPINPSGSLTPGIAYFTLVDSRLDGQFDFGTFSFKGYSNQARFVCNPCVTSLLECLRPSPVDLLLMNVPFSGCISLATKGINPLDSILDALEWANCPLSFNFVGFARCAHKNSLISNCLGSSSSSRNKRNVRRIVIDLAEALYPIQQSIDLGIEVLGDEVWISVGDPLWVSTVLRPFLDDQSESGILISSSELSSILVSPPLNGTTVEMVARMVERINNTIHGWSSGQLEPLEISNMASFRTVQELTETISMYNDIAINKGFSSYLDAYNFASGEISQIRNFEEEAGVCAVVRIRIEQELAITREAFLAKLEIDNLEDFPLEQITIQIVITDVITGDLATHLFSIGNGTLSGSLSNGVSEDNEWFLPSGLTGSVQWIIVPYSEAAPDSDHVYNVGGSFSYALNDEDITVPLYPTPIVVTPDPSLLVHYFWERNVIADDPFTDDIEASVPFTLGVAVKNGGFGTAYDLQISSAQPEIIDNERGLLISFMIIGTMIGFQNVSLSLTVILGDLAPNTTTVARWYIISSLQGEFMRYTATFENLNPLGDPKLSIIDDLQIHELIRNVAIYTSEEEDDILDFLVNDINDYMAFPDALYSSKTLQKYNVSVGTVVSVQANSDRGTSIVVFTSSNITGWVYYRYEDTQDILTNTAPLMNSTKHEGNLTVAIPSQNSWITRDYDPITGAETFYLHILDFIEITDEVLFTFELCTIDCPAPGLPFILPSVKRKNYMYLYIIT